MTLQPPRSLFGLAVHSDLPLPGLPPAEAGQPAVEVRFGAVPPQDEHFRVTPEGAVALSVRNVGRFLISGGDTVVIDRAPGSAERELRVYLYGSAFGALLHQRGLLPLHANCIEICGRAVAFLGRSGAGKSSLAHWFQGHGYKVLTDDVSAIEMGAVPLAMPGVPRLRLWKDALEAAGLDDADYPRSFVGEDKFDVPAAHATRPAPLPLAACYLLAEAGDGEAAGITRLAGIDASEALIANTYRGAFVALLSQSEAHLQACVGLAQRVPLFRASRRWGRDLFEEEAAALREHAEALLNSDAAESRAGMAG